MRALRRRPVAQMGVPEGLIAIRHPSHARRASHTRGRLSQRPCRDLPGFTPLGVWNKRADRDMWVKCTTSAELKLID